MSGLEKAAPAAPVATKPAPDRSGESGLHVVALNMPVGAAPLTEGQLSGGLLRGLKSPTVPLPSAPTDAAALVSAVATFAGALIATAFMNSARDFGLERTAAEPAMVARQAHVIKPTSLQSSACASQQF
jgi:hypothetical protein